MQKAYLNPTPDQTYELVGEGDYNFTKILAHSRLLEHEGKVEQACNERFHAFQRIEELLPDDEQINLEWAHQNSRAALELIEASAVDHFLINDFELSAALLELLLELDPEDHLEASILLAFDYAELQEWESFDEVVEYVSEKSVERVLLDLYGTFRRRATIEEKLLHTFRSRFAAYHAEFVAEQHAADAAYLQSIESEHPTKAALARELWFKTEPLWMLHPDFIAALRSAQ